MGPFKQDNPQHQQSYQPERIANVYASHYNRHVNLLAPLHFSLERATPINFFYYTFFSPREQLFILSNPSHLSMAQRRNCLMSESLVPRARDEQPVNPAAAGFLPGSLTYPTSQVALRDE